MVTPAAGTVTPLASPPPPTTGGDRQQASSAEAMGATPFHRMDTSSPPAAPPPVAPTGSRTIGVDEAVDRMLEVLMSRDRVPPTIISMPVKVWAIIDLHTFNPPLPLNGT